MFRDIHVYISISLKKIFWKRPGYIEIFYEFLNSSWRYIKYQVNNLNSKLIFPGSLFGVLGGYQKQEQYLRTDQHLWMRLFWFCPFLENCGYIAESVLCFFTTVVMNPKNCPNKLPRAWELILMHNHSCLNNLRTSQITFYKNYWFLVGYFVKPNGSLTLLEKTATRGSLIDLNIFTKLKPEIFFDSEMFPKAGTGGSLISKTATGGYLKKIISDNSPRLVFSLNSGGTNHV